MDNVSDAPRVAAEREAFAEEVAAFIAEVGIPFSPSAAAKARDMTIDYAERIAGAADADCVDLDGDYVNQVFEMIARLDAAAA